MSIPQYKVVLWTEKTIYSYCIKNIDFLVFFLLKIIKKWFISRNLFGIISPTTSGIQESL